MKGARAFTKEEITNVINGVLRIGSIGKYSYNYYLIFLIRRMTMPLSNDLQIIQEIFEIIKTTTIARYSFMVDEQTFSCEFTDNGQWKRYDDEPVEDYTTEISYPTIYYQRWLKIGCEDNRREYSFGYGGRENDWKEGARLTLNDKEYLIYGYFVKDNQTEGWDSRLNLVEASSNDWNIYGTVIFKKRDGTNSRRKHDFQKCLRENGFTMVDDCPNLGAYDPYEHNFEPSYEVFFKNFIKYSTIKSHYLGGPIRLRNRENYGT